MKKPILTIGLMTYNYGRYLDEAINGVLTQDFQDWELIISDDNSSDDTEQVVQKYLADQRIRYIKHKRNLGQGRNWEFLLNMSSSEYFVLLHADDYWREGIFTKAVSFFQQNNECDMIYFNWVYLEEKNGNTKINNVGPNVKNYYCSGKDEFLKQLDRFSILPSSVFIRNSLIKEVDSPISSLKLAVDAEYLTRLVFNARFVKVFNDPFLVYRVHGQSTSDEAKKIGIYDKEREMLVQLFEPLFLKYSMGKRARRIYYKATSKYFFNRIFRKYINRDYSIAFKYLLKSLKYNKGLIFNYRLYLMLICLSSGDFGRFIYGFGVKRFKYNE